MSVVDKIHPSQAGMRTRCRLFAPLDFAMSLVALLILILAFFVPSPAAQRPPAVSAEPLRPSQAMRTSTAPLPAEFSTARVGDLGSALLRPKLDPNYPDMEHWAHAGVSGGIPPRMASPIRCTLRPGDDVQRAVDEAALVGGGVVLLRKGRYPVSARIDLRSNVILRGEDRDACVLVNSQRTARRAEREIVGVALGGVRRAGLEDLTITHIDVEGIPTDLYAGKFENDLAFMSNLHVGHIIIFKSEDCWVDHCKLVNSGSDPLVVDVSAHITLRDNIIDGAFNKGGSGEGYYLLTGTRYVLCFNEYVRGIRHFAVQDGAMYTVILNCRLEVDLNFHGDDGGHNLVEDTAILLPRHHIWPPVSHWRDPPGPDNILFRVVAERGDTTPQANAALRNYDDVFTVQLAPFKNGPIVCRVRKLPPSAGTLYPVSGRRDPLDNVSKDQP